MRLHVEAERGLPLPSLSSLLSTVALHPTETVKGFSKISQLFNNVGY